MKPPPIPEVQPIKGLTIRYTTAQDAEYLRTWLLDPEVRDAFPMNAGGVEVEDAVRRWISFSRIRASLTVEMNGRPVGIGTLYIQNYKRIMHQTEFGIIVGEGHRGHGIGSYLLSSLLKLAKKQFRIELIHLQVYHDNPAIPFYERFGFVEFGRQTHWIKDGDQYLGRIFMERFI